MSPSTEPFDEVKYKALMDGLECSEIMLSEQAISSRLDAEYYSKRNLFLQAKLEAVGKKPMKEYGAVLDCSAFYPSITGYYSHDRSLVPFLRVNEIHNGLIYITDDTVFLPQNILEENSKTIALAYPGDIIIAKGGNTLAKVGLVTDEFPCYSTCRDVITLRTNELKDLNKYFLWAFLHSSYGQGILWRSASQTGQPHLTLPSILEIKIPDIKELQNTIEEIYKSSVDKKHQSEKLYASAQKMMLDELCFDPSTVPSGCRAEKKLSETFGATGRLDAEYYQPKFDFIEKKLYEYDGDTKPLSEIVTYLFTGQYADEYLTEGEEPGLKNYIRGTDISEGRIERDDTHCVNPDGFNKFVTKGDIATGRVGTIGNFGVVKEDLEGAICSDNILCFHLPPEYLPDVYALYFNSDLARELTIRMARGSVQQRLNQETLKEIPIPLIRKEVQQKIEAIVQESFSMHDKANKLIKIAVQAVEIAIEENEKKAIAWIEKQLKDL